MRRSLVYLTYNLLLPGLLLLGLPTYLIKGIKRGNLRRNVRERLGVLPDEIARLTEQPIWIHAVSVGEVLVAAKIIRELQIESPNLSIVFSTTTPTGYAVAERELGEKIVVIHNPIDLPWVVRKVVRQINPKELILCESEIWPNLINHLHSSEIPVLLANARLSPRSQRRYQKVQSYIAPIFGLIDYVAVPFAADVDRWANLGIERDSISVLGSVKFDELNHIQSDAKTDELASWLESKGWQRSQPLFIAAQTHAGEELICARAWQRLGKQHPGLALLIVPRHAERAPDFESELEALGLRPVFKHYQSSRQSLGSSEGCDNQVYVADTTGELRSWYPLGSVVFVGKSLAGKGGQNLVEPIQAGKTVIVGPHMQNFQEIMEGLLAAGGVIQVQDEDQLECAIDEVLSDLEVAKARTLECQQALQRHQGAAKRTAQWILSPESFCD